ncbi:Wzz/FepE/Etk N-terminal domain-containing protein [Massilia sp. YIM B02443]|uniref:Wzz/FepE/Etk N-terminal domain-containing protein n=1 Tax=Massilia sp. YIM B02443 TaxID=3050127 RepID=UPI0025B66387|nr:Wzz/FepE/Etk N-terminal domain-containing protein [Massilia sp. YIM B02443]MDN4036077.1 GNVR domain-containing protein [Massilia sp. YIM B02443]
MNRYLQHLRKKGRDGGGLSDSFFHYAEILRNGWLIAGVAALVTALGIVYALIQTPMYEANILIQIKRNAPPSGEFQVDVPAATEVEILRSRSILTRVVSSLRLDMSVEPKRFPVVGACIAGQNRNISTPGLFGQGGYVWGADNVQVASFEVPKAMLQRPFVLSVTGRDAFTLGQEELGVRLTGRVGQVAQVSTRYGPIVLLVSAVHARPGAQFVITRSSTFQVVEQLQRSLTISERGKQSNVIGVSLRGSRPELISAILNAVGKEYIQQQVAQKTFDAKNQLQFYDQQVAESKQRLQKLDARLNEVLRLHGTSDLGEETRLLAQQAVALQAKLAEREQRRVELSSRFAELHPEVVTVNRHIAELHRDLEAIEAKRKTIASAQQEIVIVNRDKQINNEMNIALLNARHKLDALALSNNVNVRLVDQAEVPTQAVTMGLTTRIIMAVFLGLLLGVAASMLKNAIVGRHQGAREFDSVRRLMAGAGLTESGDDGREKKSTES